MLWAARSAVSRWDLNEPGESIEHRSSLSKFHTDGTHTEKARDAKLEVTRGLKKMMSRQRPKLRGWIVIQENVLQIWR